MATPIPSFDEYLATLGRLTAHVDPTAATPESAEIKEAAQSLADLPAVTEPALVAWVNEHPSQAYVLALAVGLSQEKFKNTLRHHLGTSGWVKISQTRPAELIHMLDIEFDLVRLLQVQLDRAYDFGDVLVARAGGRVMASMGSRSGRRVEDEIEAIALDLGLPCVPRTQFVGRANRTAPCDLAIPTDQSGAQIVVAAKGFDSTGSKLTDAVREIEDMANVRLPTQFVMVVVDGIGWKSRQADLRSIYNLWAAQSIDGMYTLASLDVFRSDLENAARLRRLL